MSNSIGKIFKKNKYRIIVFLAITIVATLTLSYIKKLANESEISKFDSEILVVKGSGDQLDSLTLKELRNMGAETITIKINNGLESRSIEGISIEQIIGKLDYNLKDSGVMIVEDNEGNSKRLSMSDVLEPERIYLVYKIDDKPIFDVSPSYGKMMVVDTSSNSSKSWITNVKTLDIQ